MNLMECTFTQQQRFNLHKLADYLDSLPADYEHFGMQTYYSGPGVFVAHDLYVNAPRDFFTVCGTVACALGHGPAAGIPFTERDFGECIGERTTGAIDFDKYMEKFTGDDAWEWLFSDEWAEVDNHHYGAAARIRFVLDKGWVPADENQICPKATPGARIDEEAVSLYREYRQRIKR